MTDKYVQEETTKIENLEAGDKIVVAD